MACLRAGWRGLRYVSLPRWAAAADGMCVPGAELAGAICVATTYAVIYGTPGKQLTGWLDTHLPRWLNNSLSTPTPPQPQPPTQQQQLQQPQPPQQPLPAQQQQLQASSTLGAKIRMW